MKTGLIMEGGAMRGMFTAGVMDVLMENGVCFDGAVGTSAGAVFGCNYKSRQIGRVIRYNKKYCRDKRFASVRSLIKTGDLYGADFGYNQIPNVLDKFDTDAYKSSPMEFYAVCTDMETGGAVYHKCENADERDIEWMRASASMPLVSRIVEIDGYTLSDGGIADSIPVKYFESLGYDRNVVILTQPSGYVKRKNKLVPVIRLKYGKKYPKFVEAVAARHEHYNETVRYIKEKERAGEMLVIQPPEALNIKHVEHSADELERVYRVGRETAEKKTEEVKRFLSGAKPR